jgi:tetratricopeptide (TPR) repeat protein
MVVIALLFSSAVAAPVRVSAQAAPASVRELLQTARGQLQSGDRSGALESLRRARILAPNSEDVLNAFAQVALAARMLVPAITTLDALTRMCSTVSQYHYLLGVALMEGGDMVAAIESLQQADRLEPERPLTLIALGLAENNRKQYAEAKRALLHALDLEPENIDAMAALAEAEAGIGELTPAEDHARRALARREAHPAANLVMGLILMKRERYGEARDALNKAIAADPDSPAAHYQLSLAYTRLGDEVNAQRQVELYQQKLREAEERTKALRSAASSERPR